MENFFRFLHEVEFSENQSRRFPGFLWMVFFICFITNAQPKERTPEYEISLTCIFGENVENRKHKFKILDDQSEVALKCAWREGNLYCAPGDGFTYDWVPSDNVTVRRIVQDHEPTSTFCSCFLSVDDQHEYERRCTAEVTSVPEVRNGPHPNNEPSKDTPLQKFHSEGPSSNPQPLELRDDAVLIAVAVVGSVLVVVIIIVGIFVVRSRRVAEQREHQKALPEKQPLSQLQPA